jgi:hypothetical protein
MTDVKKKKLDIFRVLKALDNKDVNFFSSLTDDEKKDLQPFLVARWLSGTYSKQQVYLINEVANEYLFSLYKHKELLWYLMTMCTTGKLQRYAWNKSVANTSSTPIAVNIIKQYFGYCRKDAERVVKILAPHTIEEMAMDMGWQDDDLNKARKELGLPTTRISNKVGTKPVKTDIDFFEF